MQLPIQAPIIQLSWTHPYLHVNKNGRVKEHRACAKTMQVDYDNAHSKRATRGGPRSLFLIYTYTLERLKYTRTEPDGGKVSFWCVMACSTLFLKDDRSCYEQTFPKMAFAFWRFQWLVTVDVSELNTPDLNWILNGFAFWNSWFQK